MDGAARELVQGELFDVAGDAEDGRGYRGTVASKVAGITYRQLDYWARKQIVEPSITPSHGSGSRRLYSFKDIVILAVSKQLLDVGVNLQNVTSAIEYLMSKETAALEHTTILCDGTAVHECRQPDDIARLLGSGHAVFGISVGSIWHRTAEALEGEEYTVLDDAGAGKTHAQVSVRPIDELAASRMRRKLEHRRMARAAAGNEMPQEPPESVPSHTLID